MTTTINGITIGDEWEEENYEWDKYPNKIRSVDYHTFYCEEKKRWRLFVKKQEPKFPKVFEDKDYKIYVFKEAILIENKHGSYHNFSVDQSLPLLEQAIKYRQENI